MRLSRTEGVRDSITDDRLCLWIPDLPRNRVHHGKLGSADRRQAQDTFMRGEVRVMVATNAFGMGIDKTDIRFARRSRQLLPGVGRRGPRWRAGRLHPAFSPGARNKVHTAVALMRQRRIVRQSTEGRLAVLRPGFPAEALRAMLDSYCDRRELDQATLEGMVFYAQTGLCRWQVLLAHLQG